MCDSCSCGGRYDEINVAVEANLRKQAEVMHGIDANMQAFGDILQQNASSHQVPMQLRLTTIVCYACCQLRYPWLESWLPVPSAW